ncbi:MAG: hypothetical protein JW928_00305, partial [Candidatus Aureabacteria bacterium]|nr:hypothetical protein [Candidatus Auribacterota bacterium]
RERYALRHTEVSRMQDERKKKDNREEKGEKVTRGKWDEGRKTQDIVIARSPEPGVVRGDEANSVNVR